MACRTYSVVTLHLKEHVPWTRTLRELDEVGDVVFKDEFSHRIVAEIDLRKIASVAERLNDISKSVVYEVKIVCKKKTGLPKEGKWRIISKTPRLAAYGIVNGRYVFAERTKKAIVYKIGKPSRASTPPSLLPASAFQFTEKELLGVIEEVDRLVEALSR
ncbi:MAG: hypothetical protein F7C37_06540 [Desulfurococcales archaeon]|nr:hypothetical protein [Desulfurococcales archaeon]